MTIAAPANAIPETLPAPIEQIRTPAVTQVEKAEQPPPRPLKKEKIPVEEIMPGRGGPQHKYLQQLIKQWGDGMGFRSSIEKTILGGEGSIDVALEKPGCMISCLISVTTGEEWELASVRKSLRAGYAPVEMVCPESKHLCKLQRPIEAALEEDDRSKVHFMLPEAFFQFVQELEVKNLQKEQTVRGYKVKTTYQRTDAQEGFDRRQAVSAVVAQALKRVNSRQKKS